MKSKAFLTASAHKAGGKRDYLRRLLAVESLEPRMLLHGGNSGAHGGGGGFGGPNFVNGVEFSHGAANSNRPMMPYHMDPLAADSGPNFVPLAAAASPASSPVATENTFKLHSNPTANHSIYLDFDGHVTSGTTWNSASGITDITTAPYDPSGDGAAFNATELDRIQKVWQRVAEDFSMFNVDVTTEDPGAANLSKSGTGDTKWGVRVVITPTDWDSCGCGGFAYIGSFNDSVDEPVFVFNTGEVSTAAAISHEVGHSLYLAHDGLTSGTEYYDGHGTGETSWGPIMGSGYYPNVTTWDNGAYYNANNTGTSANYNKGANDFDVIAGNNGFSFRADEAGDTVGTSVDMTITGTNATNVDRNDIGSFGIIGRSSDLDFFKFTTGSGAIDLTIDPYYSRIYVKNADGSFSTTYQPTSNSTTGQGSDLDVLATLYDANGNVIATSNPAGLAASFTNTLAAGTYYISVDGTGVGNWAANPPSGYDQVVSQGQYFIRGTIMKPTTVNVPPVANNDSASTRRNTSVQISVLGNDSDPNNDPLTITSVSTPGNGTATINGSAITYTPATDYVGADSFTYVISDGRGGTASATVNINVVPIPPILFVDDDQGATYERFYTAALQANGYAFDTWTVSAAGTPTTTDLRNYSLVVWNTGYEYSATNSGLSADEQTAIAGYLDAGGRMFISGQDVLYNGVTATFQQNYLKVANFTNDVASSAHAEAGVAGNSVSNGLSLSLAAPSDMPSLYVDAVAPVAGAEGMLMHGVATASAPYSAINYRGNYATGGFGIVFSTAPFEAVSNSAAAPNNQATLMQRVVEYLNGAAVVQPGVNVSAPSSTSTTEAGGTATFTVSLASAPTANVTIAVSSSDTTEGTVSTSSLVFTPTNWSTPQTVTVTGVNDAVDDGNIAYSVVLGAATSTDAAYNGLNPADVSLSNTDNDTAGIAVSNPSGTTTTEAGGSVTFTVVLQSEPTANVTIPISSSNTAEGSVSSASLVFTAANWSQPQTVTVTGVDDTIFDGNKAYSVVVGAATSSDGLYAGMNPADVSLTNVDDDVAPPTKFYVVNDGSPDRTYEYDATGAAIENYTINTGNTAPRGIVATAAGDKLWVVDRNRNVYVYNNSGGLLGSWTAGTLGSTATVEGIATDGTNIWIVDARTDRVYYYANAASRLSGSQTATGNFALTTGNTNPKDVVYGSDGTNRYLWVVNDASIDKVFRYTVNASTGGISSPISWNLNTNNKTPTGITLDPSSTSGDLWVLDNGTTKQVFRYTNGRTLAAPTGSVAFTLGTGVTSPQGIADPPPASQPAAPQTSDVDRALATDSWEPLSSAAGALANIRSSTATNRSPVVVRSHRPTVLAPVNLFSRQRAVIESESTDFETRDGADETDAVFAQSLEEWNLD